MMTGIAIANNAQSNTTEVLITETEERVKVSGIYAFGQEVEIDEQNAIVPYWNR